MKTQKLQNPQVIIKIDISNVFNSTCRDLTLDIFSGRSSHDYTVYTDDGYTKVKLSVSVQVLTEQKHVLMEDADLEFHVNKTSFHSGVLSRFT